MNDLKKLKMKWAGDLFKTDMYRIFHGKAFYVITGTMIFILFIMITQMNDTLPLSAFLGGSSDGFMTAGMDITMTTVLMGFLISVYMGKEFQTGIVKNLITTHSNKLEYIIAKSASAVVCHIIFVIVFMAELVILSVVLGLPLGIESIPGIVVYLLCRIALAIPMSLLVIGLNLMFRTHYGWSMVISYVFSAGSWMLLATMILRLTGLETFGRIFNYTIAGAASALSLTPSLGSAIITLVVSIVWSIFWMLTDDRIMNKRDIL